MYVCMFVCMYVCMYVCMSVTFHFLNSLLQLFFVHCGILLLFAKNKNKKCMSVTTTEVYEFTYSVRALRHVPVLVR